MSETVDIYNQEQITAAINALTTVIDKAWLISKPVWSLTYGDPRSLPEAGGVVAGELVGSEYIIQLTFHRAGSINVSDESIGIFVITLDNEGNPLGRPYALDPPGEIILEYGQYPTKQLLSGSPFTVNLELL